MSVAIQISEKKGSFFRTGDKIGEKKLLRITIRERKQIIISKNFGQKYSKRVV